jgi:uroporphyrinogen decarboxylase
MNGLERLKTALSVKVPDRVPHIELAYNESSIIGIAKHFTDDLPEVGYFQKMEIADKLKLFDALILFIEELDVDGVVVRLFSEVKFIDDLKFVDDWGVTFKLDPSGEALVMGGPIKDERDLKGYKPPTPKETDIIALSYCVQKLRGERATIMSVRCPFRLSWNLLGGMDKLLIAFRRTPDLVHQLMRIGTDFIKQEIELSVKMGADIISLDGDLAYDSGTFMAPKLFEEFIHPMYLEIVKYAHDQGVQIFKHSDGDVWEIIDYWLESGFDGIHPFQPQCMDIGEAKEKIGDKVCLMGNIDCIRTLVSGTVEEVEEEVKQTIEIAAPKGGYILCSSNTIHPGVKPENYIAMVKALHKYGVY